MFIVILVLAVAVTIGLAAHLDNRRRFAGENVNDRTPGHSAVDRAATQAHAHALSARNNSSY